MASKTMGQDEFLQLLVAQLSSQDPLNPTKDTEFVSQMAQFTALEQTKTMSEEISAMRNEQEFLESHQFLGRAVELKSGSETISGVVTAVKVVDGVTKIEVNGELYELGLVNSVSLTQTHN
jgi:flagellar basal-body rod modification protein FlgD